MIEVLGLILRVGALFALIAFFMLILKTIS